jgi:hypothetical protein
MRKPACREGVHWTGCSCRAAAGSFGCNHITLDIVSEPAGCLLRRGGSFGCSLSWHLGA